jgi:hypothetical protein
VLRYAIAIGGTVVGLGYLGMRWSQLQWLAAALTVGLGFGLQEIFANFVSGLILLFERPFRVGDTITVGDLSGRVTRIRTRATTILDFDNKEIVVPNRASSPARSNWTSPTARRRDQGRGRLWHDPERSAPAGGRARDPLVRRSSRPPVPSLRASTSTPSFASSARSPIGRRPESAHMAVARLFAEQRRDRIPQPDLHVATCRSPRPETID